MFNSRYLSELRISFSILYNLWNSKEKSIFFDILNLRKNDQYFKDCVRVRKNFEIPTGDGKYTIFMHIQQKFEDICFICIGCRGGCCGPRVACFFNYVRSCITVQIFWKMISSSLTILWFCLFLHSLWLCHFGGFWWSYRQLYRLKNIIQCPQL